MVAGFLYVKGIQMVNEKQDKEYNPIPVWDRKLMRSVIRNQIIKKDGYHNVSVKLHYIWKQLQKGER